MNTPDDAQRTGTSRGRIPALFVVLCTFLLVGGVATMWFQQASAARPTLEVRNDGRESVRIRLGGEESVVSPGQVGTVRFDPGDSLTVFAGTADSAPSRTFVPEDWRPDYSTGTYRFRAAVQADDPQVIAFRYLDE